MSSSRSRQLFTKAAVSVPSDSERRWFPIVNEGKPSWSNKQKMEKAARVTAAENGFGRSPTLFIRYMDAKNFDPPVMVHKRGIENGQKWVDGDGELRTAWKWDEVEEKVANGTNDDLRQRIVETFEQEQGDQVQDYLASSFEQSLDWALPLAAFIYEGYKSARDGEPIRQPDERDLELIENAIGDMESENFHTLGGLVQDMLNLAGINVSDGDD